MGYINPFIYSHGAINIKYYGVMAALGLLVAYFVMSRRAKRFGFEVIDVSDMVFWVMLAGIVGARLLFIIRFWNEIFRHDPMEMLRIYNGGLVFLGGFGMSLLCALLLCRLRKWKVSNVADLFAPALPLGHAFGRIGCLLNGCCHGFKYSGPLAVQYDSPYSESYFPLQGVAALLNVALGFFILYLESKKKFENRRFLVYLICYSVLRFAVEFGRGDYPAGQLTWGLTPAQISCLWMLPLTILFWFVLDFVWKTKKSN